ncbi:hypothetical protein ABK040_013012 [Willaertia magna]
MKVSSVRCILQSANRNVSVRVNTEPIPSFAEFVELTKQKLKLGNEVTEIEFSYHDTGANIDLIVSDDDGVQDMFQYFMDENQNTSIIKVILPNDVAVTTPTTPSSVNNQNNNNSRNSVGSGSFNSSGSGGSFNSNNSGGSFKGNMNQNVNNNSMGGNNMYAPSAPVMSFNSSTSSMNSSVVYPNLNNNNSMNNNNNNNNVSSFNSNASSFNKNNNSGSSNKTENSGMMGGIMEILEEYYHDIQFIDRGGFGVVYRGINNQTGKKVAIKLIEVNEILQINQALNEAIRTTSLVHNHIVRVNNAMLLTFNKLLIEMELLECGNLMQFVDKRIKLSEKVISKIIEQSCSALNFLQDRGIVHRDIKPQNILIRTLDLNNDNIDLVLTDFGLAKSKTNNSFMSFGGTARYLAPEILDDQGSDQLPYSHLTDIFALGVTVYRLMSFDMVTDIGQLYLYFSENELKMKLVENIKKVNGNIYSDKVINVLLQMLEKDPTKRISSDKAMKEVSTEGQSCGYGSAEELYANNKYKEALDIYKKAFKQNDKDPVLLHAIGNCLREMNTFSEAIVYYEKALKLINSNNTLKYTVLCDLAYCYLLKGGEDDKKCLETLQAAEKLNNSDTTLLNVFYVLYHVFGSELISEAKIYLQKLPSVSITNNFLVPYAHGVVLYDSAEYREAMRMFEKSIELKPNFARSIYRIGLCQRVGLKDDTKALEYYQKAIDADPYVANAYQSMGNVYYDKNEYETAKTYFEKATIYNPDYMDAFNSLANCHFGKKEYEKAIYYYEKIILLDYNYKYAYYNIGLSNKQLGNLDKALEFYKKSIQIDPNYALALDGIGNILKDRKELDKALPYYQKSKNKANLAILGDLYYDQADYDKAITCYREVIDNIDKNHIDSINGIGRCYYAQSKEECLIYFERALNVNPNLDYLNYNVGLGYKLKKQVDQTIYYYKKAIDINPNYYNATYYLAEIYYDKEEYELALPLYKKANEIRPNESDPLNNIGRCYYALGKNTEAIQWYERGLNVLPTSQYMTFNIGLCYKAMKQIDKAMDYYRKAHNMSPTYLSPINGLGLIYKDQGSLELAIDWFRKAITIDPNYYNSLYNLGDVYYTKLDYRTAADYFRRALSAKPNDLDATHDLGRCYYALKEYENALYYYQQALDLKKADYILYNIGLVYKQKGEIDKTIDYYQRAIALNPNYYNANYYLGEIYYNREQYSTALPYFTKASTIRTNDVSSIHDVGRCHYSLGNYDNAIDWYFRAALLKPEGDYIQYNIGLCYYYKKNYEEAIFYFKKAIAINPKYRNPTLWAAKSYEQLKNKSQAKYYYQRVLEIEPTNDEAKTALKKL